MELNLSEILSKLTTKRGLYRFSKMTLPPSIIVLGSYITSKNTNKKNEPKVVVVQPQDTKLKVKKKGDVIEVKIP